MAGDDTKLFTEFCVLYEERDKDLLRQMAAYRGGGRSDNAAKVASHIHGQREARAKAAAGREAKKAAKEKAAEEKATKAAAKAAAKARPKKQHIDAAQARRLAQLNAKKQAAAFPPCAGSGARPRPRFLAKKDTEMTEEDVFGCSDSDSEGESIWTSRHEKVSRPWARAAASGSAKQVKA
jgi:membrane protein involved in colicin uptake